MVIFVAALVPERRSLQIDEFSLDAEVTAEGRKAALVWRVCVSVFFCAG